jgi:hypothetical protein
VLLRSLRPTSTAGLLDSRSMSPKRDPSSSPPGTTFPLSSLPSVGSLSCPPVRRPSSLAGAFPLFFFARTSGSLALYRSRESSLAAGGSASTLTGLPRFLTRGAGAEGATFVRLGRGIVVIPGDYFQYCEKISNS